MQTLVMPHFDYCDILLTDLNTTLAQRLQRVHNACVRFVCNLRKADHISPAFSSLSWLRLKERRTLHSLLLLFQILQNASPTYLLDQFQFLSSHHTEGTRLQHFRAMTIPLHRTSSYSLSFTVSVARQWNSIPESIRDCRTLTSF